MRWELSEEHADFRSVLADWLADRCAPDTLRGWLEVGDLRTFEDRFAAEGWLAVGSPEELGGRRGPRRPARPAPWWSRRPGVALELVP